MELLAGLVLRLYAWLVLTVVGSRLALWMLGRDRWAPRSEPAAWVVRALVACVAARWVGMV